jgi:hypothetical protein
MKTSDEILATVTHTAPGRCRFKIPAKRHDVDYFQSLQETLLNTSGVNSVETNPLTAGLLILYDREQLQLDDLTTLLQSSHHFELTERIDTRTVWEKAVNGAERFDQQLKEITAGQIDSKSLLFIVLLLMAVRQLQQGVVFGAASTLFWYALQVLNKDNKP